MNETTEAPTEQEIEAAIVKDPKSVLVVLFEADAEVQRLRTWLRYIEGNFRDGRECAAEALHGDAPPEGFTP